MITEKTTAAQSYLEARKVTLVGAILDLILGILKIGIGITGHSQALVADGVHSLSDLATDALVIGAMKYSSKEADSEHPYGHARIQTFATVVLGIGLVVVALGLGKEAVDRLVAPEWVQTPSILTLIIAAISIASKEWIYRYTIRVAHRLRSSLLEANAWHSRSDALSSIVVFAGIVGSLMGFSYFDAVATIIVAAMVFKVGGGFIIEGIKELVDTGVETADANVMWNSMASVEGVKGVRQFRTRMMGSTIVADVNILVSPDISVSEGHRISEEVENAVGLSTDQSLDITVHVDSEFTHPAERVILPMRSALEEELSTYWSTISKIPLTRIGLHYRAKKIDVNLYFEPIDTNPSNALNSALMALREKVNGIPHIGTIRAFIQVL